MKLVNSYSHGGNHNRSAHRLRVWRVIQFKCEGPVRWLRQQPGSRAHSKCDLRWKSILPRESTVHLTDMDGEGHYTTIFAEEDNVETAVISDMWVWLQVHEICVSMNKLVLKSEKSKKADWERKKEKTQYCQSLSFMHSNVFISSFLLRCSCNQNRQAIYLNLVC